MKHFSYTLLATCAALILTTSCNSKKDNSTSINELISMHNGDFDSQSQSRHRSNRYSPKTLVEAESPRIAAEEKTEQFETKLFEYDNEKTTPLGSTISVKISVDYPISGNSLLVYNTENWVDETLRNSSPYKIPAKANTLGDDFINKVGEILMDSSLVEVKELESEMSFPGYQFVWEIKKCFDSNKVVSFSGSTYYYMGGAHGLCPMHSQSFDKQTGKQLNYSNIFLPGYESRLQYLLRENLADYFEVNDSASLAECLFMSPDELPCPALNPIFEKNGLTFTYHQYEIAPYCYGTPQCTISYTELEDILSPLAKSMIP